MDLPESLKAALGTAGGGADAATSAVDAAVSSAVASASKLTAVAAEAVNDRVEIGRAHLEAASWELQSAEDKFFKAPSRALASAIERAPYATAAAGAALALLAVPGTRRILWHASFGRMQSEEALVRAAARSAETLKAASEGTSSELARLRDAAVAAEEEMTRGRGKLRQAAADLKRLNVIDRIVKEPVGGAHRDQVAAIGELGKAIREELEGLKKLSPAELKAAREARFLAIGSL